MRLGVVGNKVRGPQDEAFLREHMKGFELLGIIPYSEKIVEADMGNRPPYEGLPELVEVMGRVAERLLEAGDRA